MSLFSSNPWPKVPQSKFKTTYNRKLSFKGGYLVPIVCKEILPGDRFKIDASTFVRQMPLVAPTMHQYDLNFAWFFVPNRIIWDEFKDFITGGTNGTLTPQKPYFQLGAYSVTGNSYPMAEFNKISSLPDYLGFPVTQTKVQESGSTDRRMLPEGLKIDALPFRAYAMIYNYYFRDQNLQQEVVINKNSGLQDDNYGLLLLRHVCWKKDYFTSALPFTQRGPEVEFSLGDSAPVVAKGAPYEPTVVNALNGSPIGKVKITDNGDLANPTEMQVISTATTSVPRDELVMLNNAANYEVDLSSATATSINELRRLVALQRFYETKARGGGRYKEQILSFFGVVSPDARIDYPQYLGGGTQPFVVDSIAQTSNTDNEVTPLSTLAGKGLSVGNFGIKTKQFTEHGLLFCLAFARPKPSYQQGLPKLFTRFDAVDYYWPTFARLGEQEVLNQELFLSDDSEYNNRTFGYQSRYADYKFTPDTVHGQFKTTLNYWHMGRIFQGNDETYETVGKPSLNSAFVMCNPTKRVYAITDKDEDELLMEVQFNETAIRKMPYHITPNI